MKRLVWPGLTAVLVIALVIGSLPAHDVPSTQERIDAMSAQIRCPTCQGLSVAESDSPLALSAREEIARQVGEGRSSEQISSYFVSKYGITALMSPPRTGVAGVAWLLSVLLGVLAVFGVVVALRRWSGNDAGSSVVTEQDRELVDQALREH